MVDVVNQQAHLWHRKRIQNVKNKVQFSSQLMEEFRAVEEYFSILLFNRVIQNIGTCNDPSQYISERIASLKTTDYNPNLQDYKNLIYQQPGKVQFSPRLMEEIRAVQGNFSILLFNRIIQNIGTCNDPSQYISEQITSLKTTDNSSNLQPGKVGRGLQIVVLETPKQESGVSERLAEEQAMLSKDAQENGDASTPRKVEDGSETAGRRPAEKADDPKLKLSKMMITCFWKPGKLETNIKQSEREAGLLFESTSFQAYSTPKKVECHDISFDGPSAEDLFERRQKTSENNSEDDEDDIVRSFEEEISALEKGLKEELNDGWEETKSKAVGPDGGVIELTHCNVEIPAGAVESVEEFDVTVSSKGDDFPADKLRICPIVKCRPAMKFLKDVTISIKTWYCGRENETISAEVMYRKRTGHNWEPLGCTPLKTGNRINFKVSHFCKFTAGVAVELAMQNGEHSLWNGAFIQRSGMVAVLFSRDEETYIKAGEHLSKTSYARALPPLSKWVKEGTEVTAAITYEKPNVTVSKTYPNPPVFMVDMNFLKEGFTRMYFRPDHFPFDVQHFEGEYEVHLGHDRRVCCPLSTIWPPEPSTGLTTVNHFRDNYNGIVQSGKYATNQARTQHSEIGTKTQLAMKNEMQLPALQNEKKAVKKLTKRKKLDS